MIICRVLIVQHSVKKIVMQTFINMITMTFKNRLYLFEQFKFIEKLSGKSRVPISPLKAPSPVSNVLH